MQQVVLLGAAHSIAFKMARGVEQSRSLELVGVYAKVLTTCSSPAGSRSILASMQKSVLNFEKRGNG